MRGQVCLHLFVRQELVLHPIGVHIRQVVNDILAEVRSYFLLLETFFLLAFESVFDELDGSLAGLADDEIRI